MKKYLSILILIAVVLLLAFAIFREKVTVYSLNNDTEKTIDGYEYTETATYDGLLLNKSNGKVYDVYSLTPEILQLKDCPS